ncbi:adenosylcobinamide-GDP ribazoletransferase [Rubricella aquisinus]|uniref:Adenosylcobinamide-GDP ribazoletransferase n=1 Tax=Rubricella aquisinus TaxID=2028108 RepID=A0A840WLK7_9RHOB|nr:adenosylcobinamide-GDP ribazoletransferase [Rubricella aquisinus]MBB5515411.1 adenosylcobinamide-GDP ribazoletransferase [Rubricella aquisinus]
MPHATRFELHDIWVAFSLLTRLPVPVDHARAGQRGALSSWAWPCVGAILGALAGAVAMVLSHAGLPAGVAAAAALAVLALLTGALHEDGLADCADGLGGGRDKAHSLDIMKDSRIGAFGAVALIVMLLARWSGIAAIPAEQVIAGLAVAGAGSRSVMALAMRLPNAREGGLSASTGRPGGAALLTSGALSLGLAVLCFGVTGFGILAGGLLAVPFLAYARHKLGGQTGDVLGATQILSELGMVLMLLALMAA